MYVHVPRHVLHCHLVDDMHAHCKYSKYLNAREPHKGRLRHALTATYIDMYLAKQEKWAGRYM